MRPYFWPIMVGTIALQQMNGPSRLMRITRRQSSRSVSQTGLLAPVIPALLTRMSILPKARSVRSRAASTASGSVTSVLIAITFSPIAARGLLGQRLVEIPDRDPGAGGDKTLGNGAAEPLAPPVTTAGAGR